MKTKLLFTGLALFASVSIASAQCQANFKGKCNGTNKGSAYVDNNKDGICDNYTKNGSNISGKKKNSTSQCNGTGQGKGKGKGKNFVDANNNGMCDRYEATLKK
jgi:hypothetical protein